MRSERDKNHPEGTNVQESGIIPCRQFGEINPGELFGFFLQYVPDEGTIDGKGGFLFQKPRDACKTFDLHDPEENLFYQPNQPGEILEQYFCSNNVC